MNEGEHEELPGKERTEKLRGSGLKEFEKYLLEKDTDKVYATLLKKKDNGVGDIIWVGINSDENKTDDVGEERDESSDSSILSFLTATCGIKADKAANIAENLEKEEFEEVQVLLDLLEEDGEEALKDVLTDAGCKKGNIVKIKKNLNKIKSES